MEDFSKMFDECKSLKSLPDISKWKTSSVKDMSYMFHNCCSLTSFPDISNWNIFNVQNMSHMFHNCCSLTSFPDISNWNIFNVQNMSHMFHNCWSITSFQKLNWNVSNVRDMSFMFHNFSLQPFASIQGFNLLQNVDHMFTNFYNYHKDNNIINITFKTGIGSFGVQAYKDMIIDDVIDLFLKKLNILSYKAMLYNSNNIDEKANLTLEELGIRNNAIITCVDD